MIPEKEYPQAGQTNAYVSNPQLSITGSSDLRNGTSAVQLGHSANPTSPDNGNFETFSTRGQLPCVLGVQLLLRGRVSPEGTRHAT
jgi:hypothetical protein